MSFEITALKLILEHYEKKTSIAEFAKAIEEEIKKPAMWPTPDRIRSFIKNFDEDKKEIAWAIVAQFEKFVREQQGKK